jgi:hypothetical protein
MATKKVFFGSVGPFYYDDTDNVADPDGDFAGLTQDAMVTDGTIRVQQAPSASDDVVRKGDLDGTLRNLSVADIDDPSSELGGEGGALGEYIRCYEVEAATDQWTLYAFEAANSGGADTPYVCAADTSGFWLAVHGKYIANEFHARGKIETEGSYEVDATQVVTNQQAAEGDAAAVSAISLGAGGDTVDRATFNTDLGTLVTEINVVKTTLNNLLAKLRTHGLIAT